MMISKATADETSDKKIIEGVGKKQVVALSLKS